MGKEQHSTCFGCKAACSFRISGGCALGYKVSKSKQISKNVTRLARIPAEPCTRVITNRAFREILDSLESRAEAKHIEAISIA